MKYRNVFPRIIISLLLIAFIVIAIGAVFDPRTNSIAQSVLSDSSFSALIAVWVPSSTFKRRLAAGAAGVTIAILIGLISMALIAQSRASSWPPSVGASIVGAITFLGFFGSIGFTFAILKKSPWLLKR